MKTLMTALIAGLAALPVSSAQESSRLERAWSTAVRPDAAGIVEALGIARSGDLVLVEDDRGMITALGADDGRPRWFVRTPAALRHAPTTHDGRIAFAAGERLMVVDAASGALLFDEPTSLAPSGAPVALGDGLFVPSYASEGLVAVSLTDGFAAWTMRLPADPIGPAQAAFGRAIVTLDDGTLHAVAGSLSTPRSEAWTARVGDVVGRPVIDEELIVVATRAGQVVAMDAGSGTRVWIDRPGRSVVSPPVVSSAHDVVVVALRDGLRAVGRGDGAVRWDVEAAEWPVGVVAPGAVLVRRRDGTSALRDVATGELLAEGLSSNLLPFEDVLVEWSDGQRVTAYRVTR